jgi:hypothetical protein
VVGRAPRGPCCAVGITRQSARGTWAPARLRWVLAAQRARQFAGCALDEVRPPGPADWPVGLGPARGRAAPAGFWTRLDSPGLDAVRDSPVGGWGWAPRFAGQRLTSWRVVWTQSEIRQLAGGLGRTQIGQGRVGRGGGSSVQARFWTHPNPWSVA